MDIVLQVQMLLQLIVVDLKSMKMAVVQPAIPALVMNLVKLILLLVAALLPLKLNCT